MKYVSIDLGASEMRIALKGKGIVFRDATVVAVNGDGAVVKYGNEAIKAVMQSAGALKIVYPFAKSILSSPEIAREIIGEYIYRAIGRQLFKPSAIVTLPSGLSRQEEKLIADMISGCGFHRVYTADCGFTSCAAMGHDVFLPKSHLVVNLGASKSSVSLVSLGSSIISESINVGGFDIDRAISNYVRGKYSVRLAGVSAEKIKKKIGSVYDDAQGSVEMNYDGKPLTINANELSECIFGVVKTIVEFIVSNVEKIPTEHLLDISQSGIYLTGGCACLDGLAQVISDSTSLAVTLSDNPTDDAINGCLALIERMDEIDKNELSISKPDRKGKVLL